MPEPKKRGLLAKAARVLERERRSSFTPKLRVIDLEIESREQSRQDYVEMPTDMASVKAYVNKNLNPKTGGSVISIETGKVLPGKDKPANIRRLPSGIPGLDKILRGGFAQRSVNIVTGSSGSGRSTFGLQFLIQGMQKNEPGLYISFEETKEQFYDRISKFDFDVEKFEKQKKFSFIRYSPEDVEVLLNQDERVLEKAVSWLGAKRVFIDSLTAFMLLFSDELAAKESLSTLFTTLKGSGVLTVASADQDFDKDLAGHTMHLGADFVISLYSFRHRSTRQRAAQIGKSVYPIQIEDNGVNFTTDNHI